MRKLFFVLAPLLFTRFVFAIDLPKTNFILVNLEDSICTVGAGYGCESNILIVAKKITVEEAQWRVQRLCQIYSDTLKAHDGETLVRSLRPDAVSVSFYIFAPSASNSQSSYKLKDVEFIEVPERPSEVSKDWLTSEQCMQKFMPAVSKYLNWL